MARSFQRVLILINTLLITLFAAGQQSPAADAYNFVYRSWNNATGLPQNTVFDLVQDKAGYLWGATEEGLFRFDGTEFNIINQSNTPILHSSIFYDLVVDGDDIWAAGRTNIIRIRNKVEKSWDLAGRINGGWIKCIEKDRSGRLWIGTSNGKLYYLVADSIRDVAGWNARQSKSIDCMKFSTRGLVIGTSTGLFTLTGPIADPMAIQSFNGIGITAITPGTGEELWIGTTDRGLYNLKTDTFHYTDLKQPFINSLFFDKLHRLWIGYRSAGFQVLINGQLNTPVQETYAHDGIRTMVATNDNLVWMGTNSSGLVQMKPALISASPVADGLDGKIVLPIYQHNDNEIWIGTAGRGVGRIHDGVTTFFDHSRGLANDLVLSISGIGGFIYVGTAGGIDRFNLQTSSFDRHFSDRDGLEHNSILSLLADSRNRLWISTRQGGLQRLDTDGIIRPITLPASVGEANLISLFEDRSHHIYAGTRSSGFVRFDEKDQEVVIHQQQGFNADIVYSFFQDAEGDVWMGTEKGLVVQKDGHYKVFDKNAGLRFNETYRILPDPAGDVWLSGNLGLQRILATDLIKAKNDHDSTHRIPARLFNSFDGMPNSETNGGFYPAGWPMLDGTLWFPTTAGIAIVDYRRIMEETDGLDIHIQSLRYGSTEFFPGEQIKVPPGVFNFEIRYTSIDFSKASDIRFFYRLKGLSSEWMNADGRHVAFFSSLEPGDYSFEVKAERYGTWSPIAVMNFTIRPYFYQTIWFKALMVLLVLFAIFGLVHFSRLKGRRRVLEQQRVTRAQIAGQEKERQLISRELHDNVNQQLTTAKLYLDFARTNGEMQAELMLKSENVIHKVIHDIRTLCNSLTPPSLKDIGLKESLQDLVHSYRAAGKFKIHWHFDIDPKDLEEDLQFTLFRITQEQIQNIAKHAGAENVWIEFTRNFNTLNISIQDDGKGFDVKTQKYGMGFENIRNRLILFKGRMELRSTPGKGTTVQLTIPVGARRDKDEDSL